MFADFMKKIRQGMGISDNEKSAFNFSMKFSELDWKKPLPPEVEISRNEDGELPEEFIFTDDGFFYKGHRVIL